jgi:hypothetical protein
MALPSVELTGIKYDGTTLFADWSANIGPGFEYFKWTVFDLDSSWKREGQTTGTRIQENMTLATDSAYQMFVRMFADGQPIASSQIEYVISQRPAISQMVYALTPAGSLAVQWPALDQTGVARYVVSVDSTGGLHRNYPTDTNAITIDETFDPNFIWTVAPAGGTYSGVSIGPQGVPRTMVLRPPVLTAVEYDLAQTIAAWVPLEQPGAGKFVATLIGGGTTTKYDTDDFTIVIPGARDPQSTWLLAVAAESTDGVVVGPGSAQVTLIVFAPTLDELDYDAAQLTPRWTKVPPSVAVDGYINRLDYPSGFTNYPAGDVSEIVIDIRLDVNTPYSLRVNARNGVVSGPFSGVLAPLTRPATHVRLETDLTVQPLIANWTKPNGGETGFLLQFFKNGVAQPDVSSMPPYNVPGGLQAGAAWQLRLRPTGDKVKGPWSNQVPGPWLANIVYEYDRMARLKTMTWNGTAARTWSYDDAGNLLGVTVTPQEEVR